MARTPGLIVPSAYSSQQELEEDLRRREREAGYEPFNISEFDSAVHDFLAHYGVKGMKWGVVKERATGAAQRVGQIRGDINAKRLSRVQGKSDLLNTKIKELELKNETLAVAGGFSSRYKISNNKGLIKELEKDRDRLDRDAQAIQEGRLTSTQKKVIVGAAVVGVLIAANATAAGMESGAINSARLRGEAFIKRQDSPFVINKDLAGKMSADDIRAKVAAPVNPNYKKAGGKMNCRRSTFTHELRRRGYDVQATTAMTGRGQSESGFMNAVTPGKKNVIKGASVSSSAKKAFDEQILTAAAKGDKRSNPLQKTLLTDLMVNPNTSVLGHERKSSSKSVLEAIEKQGEGARGEALFNFGAFAHSVAYEVVGGKAYIFDPQKGKKYDSETPFESTWDGFKTAEITRLDNVDLDINFLTRWSTNRE